MDENEKRASGWPSGGGDISRGGDGWPAGGFPRVTARGIHLAMNNICMEYVQVRGLREGMV